MSLDPNSPVPIFRQIGDHVRRAVAAGVYRPGEMIPSLRAMAMELTVNPNTVQRAYEALEREGLIRGRKGVGMFVTEEGAAAARGKSGSMVEAAFAEGIRAARAADLSSAEVRAIFEQAWEQAWEQAHEEDI